MVYTINSQNKMESGKGERSVWKQFILAFFVNIPFFTHGLETTTLTSSSHSGHFIRYFDIQWTTTAMVAGAGVAAVIFCYVIDKYGRLTGLFVVNMLQGISLIPHFLLNNKNVYTIQVILHILAGVSSGGLFTVLPIYVREITSLRQVCLTLMMVMTTAGYLTKMIAIEVRLYVMVGLVGMQFLSMLMMVETPSYLVMVGKYESARRNLSRLTLLPEDDPTISKEISNLKDESDRSKSNGKLSVYTVWRNKIWLDSTKIGIVLVTVSVLCGSILFLDQEKTLMQLKVPSDTENILVLSTLMAGSLFCLFCVTLVDLKYMLTAGYVIMTLSIGVLAVYTQADLTVTSFRSVPVAALGVLVFGYGILWGLPLIMMVEMFNFEIRATLIGAVYAYSQIIKLLHVHTFQYIEDYVGIYTIFYIFASINLWGAVYALFVVPNVRNKSVRQIERQVKRPSLPA
ncbi:low-affinity glucose transporter HXT4-like [Trichoplusia ni]|uniref:Low-affinity glucose transporter HXT4-like n=1 Tax=Trichoplusia ni TaxID=7111 RepID=A0A7E5VI70_TRINI|nr:low-affinity glucose transporter HXT4-like [Trichoplusia ni]XP_026728015.1 low-affinity glucose transporter HXT4-like [Trichoplusia ni]XP_026728016.1 low-affinity glucose transporter HXT4-like [Trichoplusia ni]XP_026728017.1 low-affinity glucose transporter HXT4-like [Trichoplusia ni]XP_026728018.1 low-affinity glucose transporter HXT4-like [Trichoplusia ni]XP_026728019.1 low-affinity glucose transporter HXT4-like [Trichoplusia ni]XP_026728020.1 low-affinity glucose transporter HXT4-like [